jgi:hypothetical protein
MNDPYWSALVAPVMRNDMNAVVSEPVQSGGLAQMIERLSANPDFPTDKLDKLMEMQERILNRQAEMEFNSAMRSCQAELEPVRRDATNEQTNSKYTLLETLNAAIVPVYTRHGFSLSFGTADSPLPEHYRVTCLVSHIGGHSRPYHADVPADLTGLKGNPNKTRTHAFGSTMSYGRRYLTLLIFNVSLKEDDDGNKAGQETVSEEQIANIQALMTEVAADKAKFLKWAKVNALDEILACNYQAVIQALQDKRKR